MDWTADVSGYKCECGRTFFSYTEMLYHKHADEKDNEVGLFQIENNLKEAKCKNLLQKLNSYLAFYEKGVASFSIRTIEMQY